MAKNTCFHSQYFLILLLLVFFMLLYVYVGGMQGVRKVEYFVGGQAQMIAPEKLVVMQGFGLPEVPVDPSKYDEKDESAPSVDGTVDGPKSKFVFAFNECKPECCGDSGGYSCSGGCPCLTEKQKKFFGGRGSGKCGA
jgi:hypothetical protein